MSDARVIVGDCVEAMRKLDPDSVDAIVTDPPYGIGFMGHEWDQPGDYGPVRANGKPGLHGRVAPREGVPSGQRRARNPAPSGFSTQTAKERKLGQRAVDRERGGAMEAGRYDLSTTANRRFQQWCELWAIEALRVLKPGGHMLVFGGTRTYHRMASGLEDAGFEIRDCLTWLYGSGFPKSLDVSMAIDKAAGATREVVGSRPEHDITRPEGGGDERLMTSAGNRETRLVDVTAPATPEAEQWAGWGTALKPGSEPIVMARKPLTGTVAANVLEHGTGALNIAATRIGSAGGRSVHADERALGGDSANAYGNGLNGAAAAALVPGLGRWPANVVLAHDEACVQVGTHRVKAATGTAGAGAYGTGTTYGDGHLEPTREATTYGDEDGRETVELWACVPGCPVRMLDDQAGTAGAGGRASVPRRAQWGGHGIFSPMDGERGEPPFYGDSGGPSRFFYTAKASRAERNAGLADLPVSADRATVTPTSTIAKGRSAGQRVDDRVAELAPRANVHPTVKPIDLMRWCVRLVTPAGGTVLDPFLGSGTTGCAAMLEGVEFIGVEREAKYVPIAEARIRFWREHPTGLPVEVALAAEGKRAKIRESGQLGMDLL